MKSDRFFKWTLVLMVLLNVVLIVYIFGFRGSQKRPPHPKGGTFIKEAAELMSLNEDQTLIFEELAKNHDQQMRELDKQLREKISEYLSSLITEKQASLTEIEKEIGDLEMKKLHATFEHFKDVKTELSPNETGYKQFIQRAIPRLNPKRKNALQRPKGNGPPGPRGDAHPKPPRDRG